MSHPRLWPLPWPDPSSRKPGWGALWVSPSLPQWNRGEHGAHGPTALASPLPAQAPRSLVRQRRIWGALCSPLPPKVNRGCISLACSHLLSPKPCGFSMPGHSSCGTCEIMSHARLGLGPRRIHRPAPLFLSWGTAAPTGPDRPAAQGSSPCPSCCPCYLELSGPEMSLCVAGVTWPLPLP